VAESKEARKARHALELWRFIDVLRRAGNIVEEEVKFHPYRKWRVDLMIPCCERTCPISKVVHYEMIAIEIEGLNGRHQHMAGFKADLEKYAELFALGHTLLRVSRQMIADGSALDYLARRGVNVESKGTARVSEE